MTAFLCRNQPSHSGLLGGFLSKEIFFSHGGKKPEGKQNKPGEGLKCDVRALKDGLSFSLKSGVCYF